MIGERKKGPGAWPGDCAEIVEVGFFEFFVIVRFHWGVFMSGLGMTGRLRG